AAAVAAAIGEEDPKDGSAALDKLKTRLNPMTKAECEVELDEWLAALKAVAEQVRDAELEIIGSADAELADMADVAAKGTELRGERDRIIERTNVVIEEFKQKNGDAADAEAYISGVRSLPPTGGVKTIVGTFEGWLISPEGGIKMATNIGVFLGIVLLAWFGGRALGAVLGKALRKVGGASKLLTRFAAKMVGRTVLVVGIVMGASHLGVSIGPLVAALGAAGLAVALALQGTLSNCASGVMILLFRPFDEGDFVEIGGVSGAVKALSLVSTELRTGDNKRVVVPNSKVWGETITNYSSTGTRRIDLVFGIGYGDDIGSAKKVLERIVEKHDDILDEPEPVIEVHELADSSVNFVCRPWVKSSDYWKVHWELMRDVKERFDAAGISIPYPQMDVHVEK
ncbi:MAG: mechanosensitive ion channel family protein, partial [Verrucomicrobiales bacterium]|nr:mechanosensitive ion channel family protein [Verrucomicrobiales bacterium]